MVTSQFFEIYKFCVDDGHHSSFDFQVFFFLSFYVHQSSMTTHIYSYECQMSSSPYPPI